MYQVNKLGRCYQKGKPLSIDIRTQILQNAPYCTYRTLSRNLGISPASVGIILKLHRETGCLESRPQKHVRTSSKLSFEDSILLETIVVSKGSPSLNEIQKEMIEHGHNDSISISTISRHIRKNAVSGQRYSRKKLGKCALERFTHLKLINNS